MLARHELRPAESGVGLVPRSCFDLVLRRRGQHAIKLAILAQIRSDATGRHVRSHASPILIPWVHRRRGPQSADEVIDVRLFCRVDYLNGRISEAAVRLTCPALPRLWGDDSIQARFRAFVRRST